MSNSRDWLVRNEYTILGTLVGFVAGFILGLMQ